MSKQELINRLDELEALANEFINRGDFDTAFIFQCQMREISIQLYPNRK